MMPGTIVHVLTEAFQKAAGEDDEIVNEGMYGKLLAHYLEERLRERGVGAVFVCNEDWGWWIEISGAPGMGLCIYNDPSDDGLIHGYVVASSVTEADAKVWSWRKMRRVADSARVDAVMAVMDAVEAVFRADPRFSRVERLREMPW